MQEAVVTVYFLLQEICVRLLELLTRQRVFSVFFKDFQDLLEVEFSRLLIHLLEVGVAETKAGDHCRNKAH